MMKNFLKLAATLLLCAASLFGTPRPSEDFYASAYNSPVVPVMAPQDLTAPDLTTGATEEQSASKTLTINVLPASGGGTTFAVGWNKLPNATTIQGNSFNQCPPNGFGGSGYNFSNLCVGTFAAWTSFAFDVAGQNGPRMLSCANGGHSDYLGNECYEMNPRTGTSVRLNNPSTTFASSCANADASAPGSGHTYGFNIVSPRLNKLYIWARITGDTLGDGCASFNMWALDLFSVSQSCAPTCTSSWTQITPTGLPSAETIVMSSAAADLNSGLIWVWESFNAQSVASVSKFDDVTNTWTKTASLGTNATLYGSAGIDTLNQVFVVMGGCGTAGCNNDGSGNPAGNFWCDISTGCTTINHPNVDASCAPLTGDTAPSLTYDDKRQELVGFISSNMQTPYVITVTKGSPGLITCKQESYGSVQGTGFPEKFNFDNGDTTPMFNKVAYDSADDVYVAALNIDKTVWALKRPPVIRVNNTTGSPTVAGTIKAISQPFAQGDIASFPQALINGSTVTTQANVLQRWSDGSVRWAMVTFALPSISGNGTQKVYFVNQASTNTTPITQAAMLANYNFDMQIQETGTASHTISARAILNGCASITDPGVDVSAPQSQPCRYLYKGPLMTAVILEDRGATRSLDFNSDGGSGNPLHPYFECWFFAADGGGNSNADCIASVENDWASSTTSLSMRDQTYSFTLTGGSTSPITLFTQTSFNHIGRSRWMKDFCINGLNKGSVNDCATAIAIDHNMPYVAGAKAIPNFDPDVIIPAAQITGTGNAWATGDQSITGSSPGRVGTCFGPDLDQGGTSCWFGILNNFETTYWFSHGDPGVYASVLGNTQVAGRIPFHYREADNVNHYDSAGAISPLGRTVSVNTRPNENYMLGPGNHYNDTCSGANTNTLSLGTVTTDAWDTDGMDASHWIEDGYTAALITGKFWYIEETQMSGAYMAAGDRGCPGDHRGGNLGIAWASQEGRGTAWQTRSMLWHWAISPDGSPEQAYMFDKVANSGVYRSGTYLLTNPDSTRSAAYNQGTAHNDNAASNPLQIYLDGWYGSFVEFPIDTTVGHFDTGTSPWEEQYTQSVYSQARDMGFTVYDGPVKWAAKRLLHLALDPAWGGMFLVGSYRMGSKLTSTHNWMQTATDYTNAFTQGNGSGIANAWVPAGCVTGSEAACKHQKPCGYAGWDDHWHLAPLAELGYYWKYNIDGLSGITAYQTVKASLYSTGGCMPQSVNNNATFTGPEWDVFPRR